MQESLIQQGVDLMLYGMGTVVAFLAILVVATLGMSWFIRRFFPEADVPVTAATNLDVDPGLPDARLLAVIKAAIEQHRAKRG
jgi:oxaloacetate decarboxylase gamma subunit